MTFAIRGRYGFIDPYGSNRFVPGDQLFYLGGTSTVISFEEKLLRFGANGKACGGMGLRHINPIGAVGLLYGWKIDPLEGEKSSNLHFSIGYTF